MDQEMRYDQNQLRINAHNLLYLRNFLLKNLTPHLIIDLFYTVAIILDSAVGTIARVNKLMNLVTQRFSEAEIK